MKTLGFESVDELTAYFEGLGQTVLFRGQTKDYLGPDQKPLVSTSFKRKGCIPPRMLKWSYYAESLLQTFAKGRDEEPDFATTQAILQHYGWRSFFIDATGNPAVACWFAAHSFASEDALNLAEDCWEDAAWLMYETAWYTKFEGIAVVYVISKKALRARSIQAVDLVEIATTTGQPRFLAQSAWMLGPLDATLPPECIIAKILAPAAVFSEFSARSKLCTDHDLFPGPEKDPVLKALLSVPWVHRPTGNQDPRQLDFYSRGLQLPEYRWRASKRMPSSVAFYRSFWLVNDIGTQDVLFTAATYLLSPETAFHGIADLGNMYFPSVTKMLRRTRALVIEMDGLLRYPSGNQTGYGKGVFLVLDDDDDKLVHVWGVSVNHPGMRPKGYGISQGRCYRIGNDGRWKRELHTDDCPCNSETHHNRHLVVVAHAEAYLKAKEYRRVRHGVYAHEDVDPTSNLRGLQPKGKEDTPYFADVI